MFFLKFEFQIHLKDGHFVYHYFREKIIKSEFLGIYLVYFLSIKKQKHCRRNVFEKYIFLT